MMKKWMLVFMAATLFFAVSLPATVDAAPKRGGSYSSPKKSVTPTAPKNQDGATQNNSGSTTQNPGATTTTPAPGAKTGGGFFSGGGFMKGMLIGGLAGMLFGGLFGNMGFLGNILGFLINVAAIVALIMLVRWVYVYFRDKNSRERKRFQE